MKLPVLFRRRSLVLPTLPGVILILVVLGLSIYFAFQNVSTFLAVNEPIGAEYLVIEGWLGKNELKQAYRIFGSRDYRLAIVSGGPITDEFNSGPPSFAERARTYLLSIGFPAEKLFAVPAPYSAQERTFLGAVTVRGWLTGQGIFVESLDIFSGDVHSRRSRDVYRLAFGEQVEIGVYASKPDEFDLNRWWQSSDAAKSVVAELLGWLMVKCCFNPGQPGSD
ncbi:MAG: YdcF family protein [Gammaproteobacteria bacterium]|nr:YdcF family protein [Gammaproteobacteria bacterium]